MRELWRFLLHRYYHWKVGRGWRCQECKDGTHMLPWPGWPGPCRHIFVRCVHGDEIIYHGYKRGVCLDCGQWVDELPELCSVTGQPHVG